MCCRRPPARADFVRFIAVSFAALLLCACPSGPRPGAERLAVIAPDNLTDDPSLDWVGHAIADVIAERLTGAPSINPKRLSDRNRARAFRATRVLYGYFTIAGDELDLRLVLEDPTRVRTVDSFRLRAAANEVLSLAEAAVNAIATPHRPYGTASEAAFQAYAEASSGAPQAESEVALQRALEADPGYPQAGFALARLHLLRRNPEAVEAAVEAALAQNATTDPIDRARLTVMRASAVDPASLAAALVELAELTPADSDVAEQAGRRFLATHRYREAAGWFERATTAEPGRPALWNTLGYARAWAGDLAGAVTSLHRYQELDPGNPNPLDSLGEVHYHHGRFPEAARYFLECIDLAPGFQDGAALRKAAWARLMSGDRDEADQLMDEFAAERKPTDAVAFQMARWRFFTGRRRQGFAELEQLARREGTDPVLASMAYSLLTVWAPQVGRGEEASRFSGDAAKTAKSPRARTWARLAGLISRPAASPDEWRQRAADAFPGPAQAALVKTAEAHALLAAGHFAEAEPIFRELYEGAPAHSEGQLGVLLASTLIETGRHQEAREFLSRYPLPRPGQEGLFFSLSFPRIVKLRAKLAGADGDSADARRYTELHTLLSPDTAGPRP